MSELKTYKLGDIASVQTGPFGSQLHQADYVQEGTPIITVEHLGENRILHTNLPLVSDADKERLKKYWLKEGDIVFSRVGSVDRRAYVKKEEEGWLFSGRCLRVRPKENTDGKYLSYFFGLEDFKRKIRGIAVGATMPSLNTSIMTDIEVELPEDLRTQTKVAEILSSLDDKIELNLKINQVLEITAKTIFEEWFVNFNFPAFNGEFVDELPKGWKKGKLGDALELVYGKALKADTRVGGNYPVIGSSGIVGYHNTFLVEAPGIVIGRKGTIGEVLWIDENFFPIDTTFYIKDNIGATNLYYHYYLLKQQEFKKISSDSAVPGLNKNQALDNNIIIPSLDVIEEFNFIAHPFFERKYLSNIEINFLTKIRDSLLPKLMAGQIEIKE